MTKKKLSVLFLEDNEDDLLILQELFAESDRYDYAVESVASISEARGALAKQAFDLFLLDLNLPFSRGQQTLEAAQDLVTRVPTIVFSGVLDQQLCGSPAARGIREFLVKGATTVKMLERAVNQHVLTGSLPEHA